MKSLLFFVLSCSLLICAPNTYAQLYKWVGSDGKVNYSDLPPPPNAKLLEAKSIKNINQNIGDLPYELAEAVKNTPVVLYTTEKCDACDDGRTLLKNRGIPFTEKTVNTYQDIQALRQINDSKELPLLLVGSIKQVGYQDSLWNKALTAARYPETNQLPQNFQNKPSEPAALPTPPVPRSNNQNSTSPNQSEPSDTNPPTFRF